MKNKNKMQKIKKNIFLKKTYQKTVKLKIKMKIEYENLT